MNNSERLLIWSVPVRPLRKFEIPIDYQQKIAKFTPWPERKFRMPSHSFATINEPWPELSEETELKQKGYWYCAGSYCSTNNEKVQGEEVDSPNIDFAQCLVPPDIKLTDEKHPKRVIGGRYLLDFVCYNITNRILYSCSPPKTLVDLDISVTGYKLVINSSLGVYGRNEKEWYETAFRCSTTPVNPPNIGGEPPLPDSTDIPPFPPGARTRREEIDAIHFKAAGGDLDKFFSFNKHLKGIDEVYFRRTKKLSALFSFENEDFTTDEALEKLLDFNDEMSKLTEWVILETENLIGPDDTQKIYGEYIIEKDDEGSSLKIPTDEQSQTFRQMGQSDN